MQSDCFFLFYFLGRGWQVETGWCLDCWDHEQLNRHLVASVGLAPRVPQSERVITKIARQLASQTGRTSSETINHLYQRLSIVLTRANAALIIHRTPVYTDAPVDGDLDMDFWTQHYLLLMRWKIFVYTVNKRSHNNKYINQSIYSSNI